jgi:chromosome segregation ATPase
MDYEQQQEWRRHERDIESAEYDARMAIERSEREQSQARKQYQQEKNEYQREIDDIQRELTCAKLKRDRLQEALELARQALEEWHDETTLPVVIEALEYNPQEDY